ncbi:hypothetical protein ACIRBZ_14550 [Streptomyces sp. NPDC094038]
MSRVAALVIASLVLLTGAGAVASHDHEAKDVRHVVVADGYGWVAPLN